MEPLVHDEDYFEKQLKLVLLGETSTGKTCIVSRFCQNEFCRQYYPTYGVDFVLHRQEIRNGKNVTLIIWDVSGQSLNSTMLENYVYGAHIILLVYDITNAASFIRVNDWLAALRKLQMDSSPNIALIANKSDMEHQRSVSMDKHIKFANENSLSSHSISARTGENVKLTIQKICAERLGLKLSRVEQEVQQSVVKAEIVTTTQNQVQPTYHPTPSTICSIQ
uniref:Ras-related protein Rab-28 n=2 Tax=Rhodnius prolixus TaxID=13249 RepID=T1HU79_RHOPR